MKYMNLALIMGLMYMLYAERRDSVLETEALEAQIYRLKQEVSTIKSLQNSLEHTFSEAWQDNADDMYLIKHKLGLLGAAE